MTMKVMCDRSHEKDPVPRSPGFTVPQSHGPTRSHSMSDQPRQSEPGSAPTVFLETFGCQMNVLDSQLVMGQLRGLGYRFSEDWRAADVILYNTCSVRQNAEQKVYSRIGIVARHKRSNPHVVLGVIGCMAEREGTSILRRYPQIDLLCGPGELDRLPMLIENVVRTGVGRRGGLSGSQVAIQGNTHRRSDTLSAAEDRLEMLDLGRSFSPDEHHGSAYVRITRGCNKFCTFCVVPHTRGAEVHRAPDQIVVECRRLVDACVCEITLLGQTVNHYHYDHGAAVVVAGLQQPQVGRVVRGPGPRAPRHKSSRSSRITSFADLLLRIHDEVPGLRRLRFVTSFPRDFGDDVLQVMRDKPRICRYLHLPVQSGSDRILGLMNRGYTIGQYDELLDRARTYLPDVQIASDLICGFPTETEPDHQATCDLLRRARFKNCFIFKYSPRPGTAAIERLEDDVPQDVKRRRNNELLAIQSGISAEVHGQIVGRTVPVFVESISEKSLRSSNAADPSVSLGWEPPQVVTQLCGRTGGDLIVMFDGDPERIGSIVNVQIERSAPLTLFGRLIREPVATELRASAP